MIEVAEVAAKGSRALALSVSSSVLFSGISPNLTESIYANGRAIESGRPGPDSPPCTLPGTGSIGNRL